MEAANLNTTARASETIIFNPVTAHAEDTNNGH